MTIEQFRARTYALRQKQPDFIKRRQQPDFEAKVAMADQLIAQHAAKADLARQEQWTEYLANPASCLTRRGPMVGEGDAQQKWRVAQLCR